MVISKSAPFSLSNLDSPPVHLESSHMAPWSSQNTPMPFSPTFTPLRLHSPWPHRLVFLLFWPSETHACLLLYLSDSPHSQVVHLTICISLYSHIGDTQHSFVAQSKKLRIWKSFPIYRLMSHNIITFSCVLIGEDAGGRSGFQDAKGCPAVS